MRALLVAVLLSACSLTAAGELTVGEPVGLPTKGYSISPAVAYGDGSYLVVWQEGWHGLGGKADILAARVGSGGKVLDTKPIVVSSTEGTQSDPAVAYAKESKCFMVVWGDFGNGTDYDVYAARVSADGRVLDTKAIAVAAKKGLNETGPNVGSAGKDFLVSWASFKMTETIHRKTKVKTQVPTYEVLAARVNGSSGKVLDATPLALAEGCHSPGVASSGSEYLVVFKNAKRGVDGVRISLDGKRLDETPIANITVTGAGCTEYPCVAAVKNGYVAAASRAPQPDFWGWGGPGAFQVGRVTADGKAPESAHKINGWTWGQLCDDTLPNVVDSARWGKKKGEEAAPKWPKGIPGGFQYAYKHRWPYSFSSVASDGKDGCVVAWTLGHLIGRVNVHNHNVLVRHFEPENNWKKGPKIEAAATKSDETAPSIAKGPGSELLLAYEFVETGKPPVVAVRVITLR
jgi:hypothetical protein